MFKNDLACDLSKPVDECEQKRKNLGCKSFKRNNEGRFNRRFRNVCILLKFIFQFRIEKYKFVNDSFKVK